MAKWTPSANPEDLTPRPAFGVGFSPPPHVSTYEGISHVSGQLEEALKELEDVKALLEKLVEKL